MFKCKTCFTALTLGVNWTAAQAEKKMYKCNACRAEHQRAYHNRNREEKLRKQRERYRARKSDYLAKQRAYRINKVFGLTVVEYEERLLSPCQICGTDEDKVLDHCHETNFVRGVLCRTCNVALGLFKDDQETMNNAVEYLRDFQKQLRK